MNLGTIGTGAIVRELLTGVSRLPDCTIRAVYSRRQHTGAALAEAFGISTVYTCLEQMLRSPDIDTVYIASPNSLHYEHAHLALEHGKNVLLEKPFTPTLREAEDLFDLAEQNGVQLLETIAPLSLPNYSLIRERIPRVGRIRLVLCSYSQYSSRYDALRSGSAPNVFSPNFAGGALMDINLYNIYFCVSLFGTPQQITYHPNRHANGIDTSGIAVLTYPDFVCMCEGAKDTWGINSVQIQGEQGYLYVKDGSNWCSEVTLETREGTEVVNQQDPQLHWCYEVEELADLLHRPNPAEYQRRRQLTLDVVDTLERARKSAGLSFPGDR
ncbi:MAG: Gfo/Idh/MocA family protein [Butyricicoccus sp.]